MPVLKAIQTTIQENAFFIAFLALLGIAFLVLRTEPTDVASIDELNAILHNGAPTLLEFYSNT